MLAEETEIRPLTPARLAFTPSWSWCILGILLVMLYAGVFGKLIHDWYILPDFSHGFLIPFFAVYLVWSRWDELNRAPVQPTWKGIPLILLAMLTLLAGVFGAELFLSRISFVMLSAGLVWTFAGGKMLRLLAFPILVLLLAIPIPAVLFNQITFPLQLLASRLASDLLPLLHVPVLREGNIIELPAMKLEVAEACSGIRSLMSLFTLAVIYGYLLEKSFGRRVLLALASIPIAVAANALRIVGTGLCVQYWDPNRALGFFHEFSGWLMFVVSLFGIFLVQRLTHFHAGQRQATA
jgi:exosortase